MEEIITWVVIGILTFVLGCVCGRSTDRRTGDGTKSDPGSVKDSIERARDNNQRVADAERTTAERLGEQATTIERAGQGNQRAQDLVQKAKDILRDAQHTD